MNLDDAIYRFQGEAERQMSLAHMHENMMIYNQSIKNNTEAKHQEELMNDRIKSGEETEQLVKWLKELRVYRRTYHKEHEDDCLRVEREE